MGVLRVHAARTNFYAVPRIPERTMAKPVLPSQVARNDATSLPPAARVAYNRLEARPRTTRFHAQPARRGARSAVAADAAVAVRRVPGRGRRIAGDVADRLSAPADRPASRCATATHRRFDPARCRSRRGSSASRSRSPLRETGERRRVQRRAVCRAAGEAAPAAGCQDAGLDDHYGLYLEAVSRFGSCRTRQRPSGIERRGHGSRSHRLAPSRGRIADGVAVWRAVALGTHDTWLDGQPGGDKPRSRRCREHLPTACSRAVVDRLFTQPDVGGRFGVGAEPSRVSVRGRRDRPPSRRAAGVLRAEQYRRAISTGTRSTRSRIGLPSAGRSDARAPDVRLEEHVESFLPAPVRFKGQPQPRFWEMEEIADRLRQDRHLRDRPAASAAGRVRSHLLERLVHAAASDGRSTRSARSAASWWTTRSAGTPSSAPPDGGRRPPGSDSPCSI